MEPQNIQTEGAIQNNGMAVNTSGQGAMSVVPEEIKGWSWGAFGFNWIWGLFNGTFIALLMFIPLVNIIMPFVLGAKGKEWAWRNKRWESVDQFKRVQRSWGRVWWILVGIGILGIILAVVLASVASVQHGDQQNTYGTTNSSNQPVQTY